MRQLHLLLALVLFAALPSGETAWTDLPLPARTLVDRILTANRVLEPELDAEAAKRELLALVGQLRGTVDARKPQASIAVLNRTLLAAREVSYLSRQYWRDSSFAGALLRRKGNCLATTTLYVAVARCLDLPVHPVFVPEHIFACWADGDERINIETTAGGRAQSDFTYLSRFAIDGSDFAFYGWMQPAEDDTLLAELDLVAAGHLAGQRRYPEAIALMERVCAARPARSDLALRLLEWRANHSGDRCALLESATRIADDGSAPRAARVAALLVVAGEHRARLERKPERAALLRAAGLAPWHEQDEILHALSTCLRGLRDHTGAALCMELAVARDPDNLWKRAWLAGMLVEAGRMDEGLEQIARVRQENPEEVYFATLQAGLLVTAGKREEGRRIFAAQQAPRTGLENFETNRAWFLAVWGDREEFYPQFERALALASDPSVLSWIAEDDDLDKFRAEPRFRTLVEACRARLLGGKAAP